jgi:hypothetical protein
MSFVESLELKNIVYEAFANFIKPRAILFKDNDNFASIESFLKSLYEELFDGHSYEDLSGSLQERIAITTIVGFYLEDKKLLNPDNLDAFQKDLLMETAFSELKLIERKIFSQKPAPEIASGSDNTITPELEKKTWRAIIITIICILLGFIIFK